MMTMQAGPVATQRWNDYLKVGGTFLSCRSTLSSSIRRFGERFCGGHWGAKNNRHENDGPNCRV